MALPTAMKKEQVSTDAAVLEQFRVSVPCQAACPIRQDVPGYIEAIVRGDYEEAYRIIRRDNVLPGVLGRVCDRPCEPACRHGRPHLGEPVQICFLKRAAADFGLHPVRPAITPNGKKVCVIGSGPAGLTAANDLALRGYAVTMLEQLDEPGGMLRHSIPPFRLPVEVVRKDVESILALGVTLRTGVRIETREQLEDLQSEYDAVILAAGCMWPSKLDLAGRLDVKGFYWGLDFMMQSARGDLAGYHPHKVVVVGGSFVAVDCARTCYRLGANDVTMAYRRTAERLRVGPMEREALETEGIKTMFMTSPVAIESVDGRVTGVRMVRNELDENGLARPVSGSEYVLDADTVIIATGQRAEPLAAGGGEEAERPAGAAKVYLAGDFKNGSGTVVAACADGRAVAREVHEAFSGVGFEEAVVFEEVALEEVPRAPEYDGCPPEKMPVLPVRERRPGESEVETGFSREQALAEAHRCYLCHYQFEIEIPRCIYCMLCIEFSPVDCISMVEEEVTGIADPARYTRTLDPEKARGILIDQDACIRCGQCVRVCPTECIGITRRAFRVLEKNVSAPTS